MRSLLLFCFVVLVGCVQSPPERPIASVRRTFLGSWQEEIFEEMGIRFERPAGRLNIQGPEKDKAIYLHGASVASSFPSDTQYLVTITFKAYTKDEWGSDQKSQDKLNKRITDADWREFRVWAYSLQSQISMRERSGRRYYRRTLINSNGGVVAIEAEYTPLKVDWVSEDDVAIRRIMGSAKLIEDN